MILGLDIR